MQKFILLTFLLFSGLPLFSQPFDCSRFREGKFRIADTKAGVVTIAERKGMYQTESSESLKAIVRFRITWQDNCNFTLKLDKVLRNENKIDFPPGMEVHVKITRTSANSYIQEVSSSINNSSYIVEANRIN